MLPTGGGKSLCYQAPAAHLKRLAVVVSPLIALMKDQVDGLRQAGVPAAVLNSSQAPAERAAVIEEVDRIVEGWTVTQSRDDAVAVLMKAKIPCAPVRSLAELLSDPFTEEKGVLPTITHPSLGPVRVFGNPVRMSEADERAITPAPFLGQDTDEVLASRLGLGQEALAALRADRVIN